MKPVRTLIALLVLTLGSMGTWVWKLKQEVTMADFKTKVALEGKARALAAKDRELQDTVQSLQQEQQKDLQRLTDEWEKKLEGKLEEERKLSQQKMAAAFQQFSNLLEGNHKTVEYLGALEQKVKAGQALSKGEAEKLTVIATGLGYLQKQYQKPIDQFKELEAYLAKKAEGNPSTPNMNFSFWKRMFSPDFREKEREYYRSEGERRAFQDSQAKFGQAYASAQRQMRNLDLETDKVVAQLNAVITDKQSNVEDLSGFFDQARKALTTHQKMLDFEPPTTKPETVRP